MQPGGDRTIFIDRDKTPTEPRNDENRELTAN
jgi:hypothetical protein